MLLLLPPSETKRDGGTDHVLDLAALSYPELSPQRRKTLAAVRSLSTSVAASSAALGLGPTQRFEVDRNRALRSAPVLPAIERYTGVLYDGLDAASLTSAQRAFAAEHLAIQSALFGLLGADDPIPAYRLSHDSRLPGVPLRRHWAAPVAAVLETSDHPLILDLRSEAYAHLGTLPARGHYLRVLSDDGSGRRVALSHFNKKAKGEFTRAVIEAGIDHVSVESLLAWASAAGIRLDPGAAGELDLVVSGH